MSQDFVKGYTNNHLTWVMVDSTDFATPESALSAATKIKIYGKLKGATGVNFVSSGTGSLTNDIQHVGASALGIYTIALAKADLSDASAAWYDQYVISLSATGAAYQTLVVDGGIMKSHLSAIASDLYSLLSDHHSDFQSRVPKAVATQSLLSDVHSDIKSYLAVMSDVLSDTNSKIIVMSGIQSDIYSLLSDHHSDFQSRVPKAVATQSLLSDVNSNLLSYLAVISDVLSDTNSKVAAGTSTSAIAAKVWSDYESKVGASPSQVYSDILSAIVANGGAGATASAVAAKVWSDYQSKVGQTPSQVYSYISAILSDLNSRITDTVATASDVASKVWAEKYTAASNVKASTFGSMMRVNMSRISDTQSYLTAMSGMLSDVDSALTSQFAAMSGMISDLDSSTNSQYSDLASKVTGLSGMVSDLDSSTNSQYSDLASKIGNISVTLGASDISDISSQIIAGLGTVDANVVQVTGTPITGTGTEADPWGP